MGLLRLIFALAVVFQHSPWNGGMVLVGGRNAVQLFYMISGFLISYVLTNSRSYQSVGDFYLGRLFRLLPIYYVVAAVSLLSAPFLNPALFDIYKNSPIAAQVLLVISNVTVFGQDWVMFSGVRDGALVPTADFRASEVLLYKGLLVPQAWTLGVELSFYLVAPFIFRAKRAVWILLLLSVFIRLVLIAEGTGRNDPWTYRFFPSELAFFLLGSIASIYLLPLWKAALERLSAKAWGRSLPSLATATMLLLSVSYFVVPLSGGIKSLALFAIFFLLMPLTFIYQNESTWDKRLAELSYPVYVSHMLIVFATETYLPDRRTSMPLAISLINVVGAIGLAAILNHVVGEPVERYRARFRRRQVPQESA
ncbi:MAG: acyltransferase [Burkholderiales bacterium PBB5]|nr:MAG: acyltransferase [Burkholderiales bacterium PBB5]